MIKRLRKRLRVTHHKEDERSINVTLSGTDFIPLYDQATVNHLIWLSHFRENSLFILTKVLIAIFTF